MENPTQIMHSYRVVPELKRGNTTLELDYLKFEI